MHTAEIFKITRNIKRPTVCAIRMFYIMAISIKEEDCEQCDLHNSRVTFLS